MPTAWPGKWTLLNTSAKAPLETMTKGRIYVTIGSQDEVKYITFYDKNGRKNKQIDIKGKKHQINGVWTRTHTHLGYDEKHTDKNTRFVSKGELKLIAKVLKEWYNHTNQ